MMHINPIAVIQAVLEKLSFEEKKFLVLQHYPEFYISENEFVTIPASDKTVSVTFETATMRVIDVSYFPTR